MEDIMTKNYEDMTTEELCVEYQRNPSNELFEYFLTKNEGLIYEFIGNVLYKFPQSDQDDLLQYCKAMMWEAMRKFDNERHLKFSTLYYYYVKKALELYMRNSSNLSIRIPAHARYAAKHGDPIYKDLVFAATPVGSLDEVINQQENETFFSDIIKNPDEVEIIEQTEQAETKTEIDKILSCLSPREQRCVKLYYGFVDGSKHTLEEIGAIYGVTRERIRQIIAKALVKLKPKLKQYQDDLLN